MKRNRLLGIVLTTFAAAALQQAAAQPFTLTGTSYTNTFDDLESLGIGGYFEPGWYLYTGASSSSWGSPATWNNNSYYAGSNTWRASSGRFANQASSFSYIGGTNFDGNESTTIQKAELNRCVAIRQTGSFGDPGAAFVFKIQDTLNRQNFQLYVDMLNLDPTSPRTTTWTVDYGLGASPTAFVPITTFVNTAGSFTTTHLVIPLPNGTVDNNAGPVWIRIAALSSSSSSGNRETFGIDNFGLTWVPGGACTPASITAHPAPVAGYINGNASFSVSAVGTAPLNYVWVKNGSTVLSDDDHFSGTSTPNLTITTLSSADAGTYSCIVSNTCDGVIRSQTSTGAALTVSSPPAVSIAYLHTLVNPDTFMPTNMSKIYQVTGIITTATNLTTGNTASYYLQDGTGGINLFCTFGSTFRPALGDEVTAVGYLNGYQGNLEIEAELNNPAYSVSVLSNNIANYPKATVVAWDNLWQGGTNAALNYGPLGSVVILTNVYFGTNAGFVTTNGNLTCVVTNGGGQLARVYFPCQQNNELTNRTIPAFAYAVQGPLVATSSGYSLDVTRWADVMTSPLTIGVTRSGSSATITWTAVPLTYSYTVLGATDVKGPYSVLATGLKFTDANGTYTDNNAGGSRKFFKVTSP